MLGEQGGTGGFGQSGVFGQSITGVVGLGQITGAAVHFATTGRSHLGSVGRSHLMLGAVENGSFGGSHLTGADGPTFEGSQSVVPFSAALPRLNLKEGEAQRIAPVIKKEKMNFIGMFSVIYRLPRTLLGGLPCFLIRGYAEKQTAHIALGD